MNNPQNFLAWSAWALRIALAAAFLSAVADRVGVWGPPGASGVAWGDWAHFRSYSDHLNAWLPTWLHGPLAYFATAAEVLLAIALLALPRQAWVGAASGALLSAFALSMTFAIRVTLSGGRRHFHDHPRAAATRRHRMATSA